MTPLIKFPGSKRRLADTLLEIARPALDRQPAGAFYFEPFFGSGALFFALRPEPAVISDVIPQLVSVYMVVDLFAGVVANDLEHICEEYASAADDEAREAYYYGIRDRFNEADTIHARQAAQFIWLNRACFNGLVRFSEKTGFNVPWGQKETVSVPDREQILEAGRALRPAWIRTGDFEDALKMAKPGDFIYADPPYHSQDGNGFTAYSGQSFGEEEQRRLAKRVWKLTMEGVYCLVSNADTPFIRKLYKGMCVHEVNDRRSIAADGESRGEVQELIISNFDDEGEFAIAIDKKGVGRWI